MSKPIARKVELLIKIRAILWNILHLFPTLISRKYTSRLGPSYNSMLFDDANEVITVVIPCYNYANFVEEAVDSVLLQTVSPKQIIIINDGSTDNTSRVLNKYKDNKKIQIVNRGNKGVVATKNEGARLATGTWLMFLDADDRIPRNYLALLLKSARLTKKDVIYTDAKYFGAKRGIQSGRRFSIRTLRKGNYIHNSALIKKALFDKCGGYDAAMSGAYEDWELYLSLYEVGAGFHYSKDTALDYRKHENEIGRNVLAPNVDLHYKLIIKQLHPKLYGHGYLIDLYLFSVLRKIRFFLLELGGIRPSNPGLKLSDYPRLSFIARNAHRLLQLMVHPSKLVKALRLSPSVVAAISSRNKHKLRELKKLIFS